MSLEKDFYLAGHAIFTVVDSDSGERSTFKIARVGFRDRPADYFFAHVLTGPDNLSDYSYLCKVDPVKGELRATQKSRAGVENGAPWKRLQSALDLAWGRAPEVRVVSYHCGRCARCGRMLTDPESIARGIGPVCIEG